MKRVTSRRQLAISTVLVMLSLAASGCLQGSNYHRPPVETPADWTRMASGPLAAGATHKMPEADWWQAFHNEELTRFVERALAQNHDVRRAVSRVLEGRASVTTAGAGLYPQLNVQGNYSNIVVSKNTLAGLGLATGQQPGPQVFAKPGSSFDLWNGAADLRWELDVWGRIRRGMEAASADAQAIEQDARAIALTLIGDVGQSYFRIRELDEQIEIAQRALTLRRDSLDIITKRASVGLASDLDVKRTEVLVAESAGQIPDLTRLRAVELHRLEVLTGSAPGSVVLAPTSLRKVIVQPEIPVGLPSQLLERRPDILQAEASLVAANARIGQARAYFFPTLSITGQGGLQSAEFVNWFSGNSANFSIGPSVTLPIFMGGTNVARLEAAESRYQQMLEGYQQTILVAFREVADLLVSIQSRSEQLARQREQATAATAAVGLAEVRYRKGLVNYLDVLDAQRTMLAAETQLAQTERARLTDMVGLYKALGGGWQTPGNNLSAIPAGSATH
ncbi:MAG: efflux transporter outer membrane subunit [Nitrospira sp.]|nr:efflux transporter outer membrane subunit [Nitrospira sp.]